MHVTFSDSEQQFQTEVREFFSQEYPQDVLQKMHDGIMLEKEDFVRGQKAIYEKGWAGVNWPEEYGGTGWSATQKHIFYEEMAAANCPSIVPFGLSMVGPVIYTYGSEAQKQKFLPGILSSDEWWCQGYSEPGSGSDLASLKMRAERDGDEYVLNGTKTWTTLAQHADWMFLLARTNTDVARKQEGISFLLVKMDAPGISLTPIITLDGEHEINSVFFDNVRIPADQLVGEEGKGWTYGKLLLTHERANIAGVAVSQNRLEDLKSLLAQKQASGGAPREVNTFARKIAHVEIQLHALEYTELRTLASVATGKAPGPESSILKIKGTEIQQAIDNLYYELAGYNAIPYLREQFAADYPGQQLAESTDAWAALRYFNFRKASIYGGSNEIQKNIIAKAVLGV
ncbi:MAG: pimeloyl-CoA dehydrogenase large subunit [Gammaproteobacteria bacterium]|nr:pimeloyl-CoA dehydrogenase large subunit [Gammaproteobacteria bacterium]